MVSVRVKEALHPALYLGSYAITPSMVEPVLSGIMGNGKLYSDVSDVKIKLE
jgi:hypothetical protein